MGRDWVGWHEAYERDGHPLRDRLVAVVRLVGEAVTSAPPGPVRLASLCAGDGRDVVAALADHPRRGDVLVRLVELDPDLADSARAALGAAGIAGEVVTGDAGHSAVLADVAPVDVLLLCGIFGNIGESDVERTIAAVPSLCRPGATVVWTRHRRAPDLTPSIRRWFDAAGCRSLALHTGEGDGVRAWAAGAEEVVTARAFRPTPLFRFRTDLW
ncbi:MAG TPA: hypothetical protein VK507_09725 [Iamia sp.]|nr:hypothetical protein [Iamia sp.]